MEDLDFSGLLANCSNIEANANRYTFVWRGTLNYHLAGLLDPINLLYEKYNILIDENEYDIKYNIQIAVENYFIVQAYAINDRTDYNTLIPVLEKHKNAFGEILEEVTADSGYCSEKNLLESITT